MLQDNAPLRCPFANMADALEALARKPLQPRRALLRRLAVRFRTAAAAERAEDRRAA